MKSICKGATLFQNKLELSVLIAKVKTVDSFVLFAANSIAITQSFAGFGLMILTITIGVHCDLTFSIDVLLERVTNKQKLVSKSFERWQHNNNCFGGVCRKYLQYKGIGRKEY